MLWGRKQTIVLQWVMTIWVTIDSGAENKRRKNLIKLFGEYKPNYMAFFLTYSGMKFMNWKLLQQFKCPKCLSLLKESILFYCPNCNFKISKGKFLDFGGTTINLIKEADKLIKNSKKKKLCK